MLQMLKIQWQKWSPALAIASGPALAGLVMLFWQAPAGKPQVPAMAAITLWVAVWWITEALPLAISAMLPLVLFPLTGVLGTEATAAQYINDIIFLYIGGFMLAFAMEKWHLHTRIAQTIIQKVGASEPRLLLGFMFAAYFLSLWISNVATTMALLPPALALVLQFEESRGREGARRFASALLMGIAFSASIGGTGTPVGTAPNMIFLATYHKTFPQLPPIGFGQWMLLGIPISFTFWAICYFYLKTFYCQSAAQTVDAKQGLKRFSYEEKVVAAFFVGLVGLWLFRSDIVLGQFRLPGWSGLFGEGGKKLFADATPAVLAAILLFVIPSKNKPGEKILSWKDCEKLPMDVILLFGGGFALAKGFETTGLSAYIGEQAAGLNGVSAFWVVVAVCAAMSTLTEIASNTASVQLALPILAALAPAIGIHPLYLMLPATFSASFGFMLPVATPPSTIVYGYGRIKIREMARAGFFLDLIGVVLVVAATFLLGKWVFGLA